MIRIAQRPGGNEHADEKWSAAVYKGHSDYCRFIVLGRGRSGSNLLRGLLNSHSRAVVFGELFRFFEEIGWEFPEYDRYCRTPPLLALSQTDPARFLDEQVFKKYPRQVTAVGFKLFYYHAQEDGRKGVWPALRDRRDLKVIHLTRGNTLRQLLSEKKAFLTNRWTNVSGEPEAQATVSLDYDECLYMFRRAAQEKEQFAAYFAGHDMMEVTYEDLAADYRAESQRIQSFLGLDYEQLKPRTYRQSTQPLAEAIANYADLKARFGNTRWAAFFEE